MIVQYRIKCPRCFQESIYDFDIEVEKPVTNADRIRSMTDEEMASILTDDFCELICSSPVACNGDCEAKMFEWLKKEAT